MKTVLWISRHNMAPEQMTDLERIMGGPVCLRQWLDTVIDIADLAPAVREADAVAAVLPPELLAELLQLAEGRPVFFAVSGRVTTGKITESREPEFVLSIGVGGNSCGWKLKRAHHKNLAAAMNFNLRDSRDK